MATLRKQKKVAALNRDNHQEQPSKNASRDTNVPVDLYEVKEDCITQISEEIETKGTKKLSPVLVRQEAFC